MYSELSHIEGDLLASVKLNQSVSQRPGVKKESGSYFERVFAEKRARFKRASASRFGYSMSGPIKSYVRIKINPHRL